MKLFAAFGPGDIVAAHRAQMSGGQWLSETSIIYSGQLVEYCRERGISLLGLSYNSRTDSLRDDCIELENQPRRLVGSGGARYHFSMVAYAFYLAIRAWRFGADLAIIDSGSAHYFALASFPLLGIPVAVDFHNTLWPAGFQPKQPVARLVRRLDAWFFRHIAVGAVGVSPECGRQVHQLAVRDLPYHDYRGQFRRAGFQLDRKDQERKPFRVLFASRAERNKGLLDLADIAEQLCERSSVRIVFDVCGDGTALNEFRRIVETRDLADTIIIHGRLTRPELVQMYARAHAVIVPTRSDFVEGFAQVCAEAIIAGRPVITNSVVPALEVLRPACLEAHTDNVESYVEAILKLAQDSSTYDRLCNACADLSRQFFDRSQSYPAAVDRLLVQLFPTWKVLSNYDSIFARVV